MLLLLILNYHVLAVLILETLNGTINLLTPISLIIVEQEIDRLKFVEPGILCVDVLVKIMQRQAPKLFAARRSRDAQIMIGVCLIRLRKYQQTVVCLQ